MFLLVNLVILSHSVLLRPRDCEIVSPGDTTRATNTQANTKYAMKKIYTITQTRTQTQTNKDLDIVSIPQYEDHEKQQPHKHSRKHKQTITQMHKQTRALILYKEYHEKQTLRIKEASVNHKTWKSRGAKVMLACYAILRGLLCSLSRLM